MTDQISDTLVENSGLIYLASPYSHPDWFVRLSRFDTVTIVAAKLISKGLFVYSPITHSHPILCASKSVMAQELPGRWEFWQEFDRLILSKCSKLLILRQDGWNESKGVKAERDIARELGIPVEFIDP